MSEHVFKKGKGYPDRRLMHPRREWVLGVMMFLTVIFVGGVLAAQAYVQYRDIEALEEVALQQVPQYNDVAVQNVLTLFRERNTIYEDLTYMEPAPVTPVTLEETVGSTTAQDMVSEAETDESVIETEDVIDAELETQEGGELLFE